MVLISVIVPTCHRDDLLAKCLAQLAPGRQEGMRLAGTGEGESAEPVYEVIVSDDGSKTSSQAMVTTHFPWARWVAGPRRGPAANRNNGAHHASGEWLAFVDDDCIPTSGWLSGYRQAFLENPKIRAFEGKVAPEERPRNRHDESAPLNGNGNCFWSCNISMKRTLFEQMNGFDEDFPLAAMEDVDLRTRLQKAGELIGFGGNASVCHPWRPVFNRMQTKAKHQSVLLYYQKHPDRAPNTRGLFVNCIRTLSAGFYRRFLRDLPACHLRGLCPALENYFLDFGFELRLLMLCLLNQASWRTHEK